MNLTRMSRMFLMIFIIFIQDIRFFFKSLKIF